MDYVITLNPFALRGPLEHSSGRQHQKVFIAKKNGSRSESYRELLIDPDLERDPLDVEE